MKLCRECRHFSGDNMMRPQMCLAPGNVIVQDFVNGGPLKPLYTSAQAVRQDGNMCSPAGKWFEPKTDAKAAA